ncbi:MAG TPA: AAA family ATPase [Gaiellaceae bacterium]
MGGAELLGRENELAVLRRLLERAETAPAGLLLEGEAGIGKTMLWREGIALAEARGFRVLTCEAAPTETPLAYAGLGDLLDEVPLASRKRLPPPQRRALETSLLLIEPGDGKADQRAVSVAVLTLIRALATKTPVLIAIDGAQWLDGSTARVLAFVLRRLREGPIGLLMTQRSGEDAAKPPLELDRNDGLGRVTERLVLGPLSLGAVRRLLTQRTGHRLPRALLNQLHRATGGNPLYALELARVGFGDTSATSIQPLRVPEPLRALVSERLVALPEATRETLLIASALAEPTVELVQAAGGGSLSEAIENSAVELDGERIRFTNSLLASVLYAEALPEQRRKLHRRLATLALGIEERAWHLALGNDEPDAKVAEEIGAAAEHAGSCGAPEAAAEFFEHAARLTPSEKADEIRHRRHEAAYHHFAAGDVERAKVIAEQMLSESDRGPWRADVLVLLAFIVEDEQEAADFCRQAIEAAGKDQNRLAMAYIALARACSRLGDFPAQANAQREALAHAKRGNDRRLLVEALQGVGNVTVLSGGAIDEKIMQKAITIDREEVTLPAFHSPSFWYGMQLYWLDELDRARPILSAELERAQREGELIDSLQILSSLIEVELRSGNWDLAGRMADEGLELALDIGYEFTIREIGFQQLQLAVLRGEIEKSRQGLEQRMAEAERAKHHRQTLALMSLAGFFELSLGNAREAWRWLKPALDLQDKLGRDISIVKPLYMIRPNAIETLIALDEVDRAERLLEDFERHVAATKRPNAIVSSARSRALVEACRGNLDNAARAIERAIAGHEQFTDPFERGRTMLIAGTIEHRAKRKRKAREALEQAREIFEQLGARLWLEKTQATLERTSGGRNDDLGLTPNEQRVVELVTDGCSNKEIATALFVSVRTVEANLSKIYRKLGVESRSELAGRIKDNERNAPEKS